MNEFRDVAIRIENANAAFIETLMELGGISRPEAIKAMATLRRAKALKLDVGIGRYTVKHGAYLDRDVIRRAAQYGQA